MIGSTFGGRQEEHIAIVVYFFLSNEADRYCSSTGCADLIYSTCSEGDETAAAVRTNFLLPDFSPLLSLLLPSALLHLSRWTQLSNPSPLYSQRRRASSAVSAPSLPPLPEVPLMRSTMVRPPPFAPHTHGRPAIAVPLQTPSAFVALRGARGNRIQLTS
jgi:hypothetical protein